MTDDASIINSLNFIRQQLRQGEATPAIKAVIHELIKKAKLFDGVEASSPTKPGSSDGTAASSKSAASGSGNKASKSKKPECEYEAECPACLEERVGRFYKRGFKCNWCAGTDNGMQSRPVAQSPAHVPSAAYSGGFTRLCVDNDVAMNITNVFFGGANSSSQLSGGLDRRLVEANNGGGAGDEGAADAPGIVIDQNSSMGNTLRAEGSWIDGATDFPATKYGVSVLPCSSDASPLPGGVRVERIGELRRAYFPTLLYTYAACRSADGKELTLVTEAVRLLSVRGAVAGPPRSRCYEVVMQVALSALHAMQYLKETFGCAHGDLRPYNFFLDEQHNVKLRHAAFDASAPLAPPFRAPEDDVEYDGHVPAHRDPSKAPYARDMYALGVTLSLIAYGNPYLPPMSDVSPGDETAMVRFLESLLRDDPNERSTIAEALASRFHSTVRVVNGVPLESIYCRVDVAADDDDVVDSLSGHTGADALSPVGGGGLAENARSAMSISGMRASPMSNASGSFRRLPFGGSMAIPQPVVPDVPDLVLHVSPSHAPSSAERGAAPSKDEGEGEHDAGHAILKRFFETGGPQFQVVRTTAHVTVYSVKKDPRRRAHVAFMDVPGADGKSSPTESRALSSSDLAPSHTYAFSSASSIASAPRQRRSSVS